MRVLAPFVQHERVTSILSIAKRYSKRPSEILDLANTYIAFCFDEVCSIINAWIEDDKKPFFKQETKTKKVVKYKSFSDMYKSWGVSKDG